jgi:large subunit ribosomal protein L6
MSRIGKKIILIPEKTEVTVAGGKVNVKGPKGSLERTFGPEVVITMSGKEITLALKKETKAIQPIWGTTGAHITNMIKGVNEMFSKKLILEGIGYKAEVKGTDLVMALGFSHPVKMPIPASLKVTSDKGIVTVTGLSRDEVGQFAANIRAWKKPEPYKGKGFHYDDEVVRRKQGKKSV